MARSGKVIICGTKDVGKTEIFYKLKEKYAGREGSTRATSAQPTALDTAYLDFGSEGETIRAVVFDIPGSAEKGEHQSTTNQFKHVKVAVLVYSIDKEDSLEKLGKFWITEIKDAPSSQDVQAHFLLVGNKFDLPEDQRKVNPQMIDDFKSSQQKKGNVIQGHFEVSAQKGDGIEDLAKAVEEHLKQQVASHPGVNIILEEQEGIVRGPGCKC